MPTNTGTVYHWAAGIATDDIAGVHKIQGSCEIHMRFAFLPDGQQIERRPVFHLLCPFIEATRRRKWGTAAPFSWYPFTEPKESRRVKVASG